MKLLKVENRICQNIGKWKKVLLLLGERNNGTDKEDKEEKEADAV